MDPATIGMAALNFVRSKLGLGLIIALPLALALGMQTWRVRTVKHDLTTARATIARIEQASLDARNAQIAANQATEARYRAQAETSDHVYKIELARAADAAGRYADSHRVRPDDPCRTGPAPSAAESDAAARADRSGEATDMVAVSRADFDTLTENTARLVAAHDWAAGLVKDGLAAPVGDGVEGR